MTQELPKLVVLDLYRSALNTAEKITRGRRDKKAHAWVEKEKDRVCYMMMDVLHDEMYDVPDEESEKEKADKEFYQ